jgi:TolB protein
MTTPTRILRSLSLSATAAFLATFVPSGPAGAQVVTEERIAFTERSAPARPAVYSMRPDGSGLRREIRSADRPALSPTGDRIAFDRVAGKGKRASSEIFVYTFATRKTIQLTDDPNTADGSPDWSPDGTEIVWRRDTQIWTMAAGGSNELPLRTADGTIVEGNSPAWSHDGDRIVYYDQRGEGVGDFDIFVLDLVTKAETQLTGGPDESSDDRDPQWSPLDDEIVFSRAANTAADEEIWIMNSDGSAPEALLFEDPGRDASEPMFSPSGAQIAFECDLNRDFDQDICTMNANGTGAVARTTSGHNFAPDWGLAPA